MLTPVIGALIIEYGAPAFKKCQAHDWKNMPVGETMYRGRAMMHKTCSQCSTQRLYESRVPAEQMSMFPRMLASC